VIFIENDWGKRIMLYESIHRVVTIYRGAINLCNIEMGGLVCTPNFQQNFPTAAGNNAAKACSDRHEHKATAAIKDARVLDGKGGK